MDETQNGSTGTNGHDPATDATSADPAPAGTTPAGTTPAGTTPAGADETFGWTAQDDAPGTSGSDARTTAERMLGQLQSMIDTVATQAAPVVRQIGAKAAELAAVAADRAGPLAHRAADATEHAGERLAERSRTWAADLRSRTAEGNGGSEDPESDSRATVAIAGADDPIEEAAHDQPAEGPRV